MIIEGKEVLLIMPEFSTAPKFNTARQKSMVGISQAPRLAVYTGQRQANGWNMRFAMNSRAEIRTLEAFFYRMAGRWGSFWLPSWHGELNPVASLANGASALSISPVRYATIYDPTHADTSRPGHYIFLQHIEGTLHVSKVNTVSGAGPEVLALNTAAARDWNLGSFFAGFVYLVRFTTDKLSLEYSGLNSATCSLGVIEDLQMQSEADA
jgi:hypothetical protein